MTPAELIDKIRTDNVRLIDIRFTDMFGQWQHFTIPTTAMDESIFTEGLGFDGSSLRAWKTIDESDMLVVPDSTTAVMDPFYREPTLVLIGSVLDPITKEEYTRDPRNVARLAEQYVRSTGIADTVYFGPEAEFFLFDSVQFQNNAWNTYYRVTSEEGIWTSGEEGPNTGHRPRVKGGYFPVPPIDRLQDLRSEMVLVMEDVGMEMECQHHEVATAGQAEIDMRYDTLVAMADKLQWYKYIVKNVAVRAGKTATFMPKPLYDDNGSGMHIHASLWKDGTNLFAGDGYAGLSDMGRYAIGGILRHADALIAFTNPTTNSFKRLVPNFEAPVKLAYSSRNRSAAVRIPMFSSDAKAKRFEFRCPDAMANGYLAFSAMTMAMIDGVQNRIDPGEPLDKNIYDLPPEEMALVRDAPTSLEAALDALESDHEFLLHGDVFGPDFIRAYIDHKRTTEVLELKTRPHPYEFEMYFDG
jgi:glutamine synthetase